MKDQWSSPKAHRYYQVNHDKVLDQKANYYAANREMILAKRATRYAPQRAATLARREERKAELEARKLEKAKTKNFGRNKEELTVWWAEWKNRKGQLYRHWNADGVLLYVGISLSAVSRLRDHRSESPWYHDIAIITIENHETYTKARAAEILAIRTENPLHNRDRMELSFEFIAT